MAAFLPLELPLVLPLSEMQRVAVRRRISSELLDMPEFKPDFLFEGHALGWRRSLLSLHPEGYMHNSSALYFRVTQDVQKVLQGGSRAGNSSYAVLSIAPATADALTVPLSAGDTWLNLDETDHVDGAGAPIRPGCVATSDIDFVVTVPPHTRGSSFRAVLRHGPRPSRLRMYPAGTPLADVEVWSRAAIRVRFLEWVRDPVDGADRTVCPLYMFDVGDDEETADAPEDDDPEDAADGDGEEDRDVF